ncbi:MAG: glycosyltransferase family 39 protein, partial [Anaerolineae bacterium]|nr:glycosyltransferase family 39 protein [Anaerolineae bacterium]
MLLLLLTATWVRLWRFPDLPPAFNYDESYNVIDALWLWETGSQTVFLPGNTGRHALFHYLAAPLILLLQNKIFGLRFVSVMMGLLTIALTYRWVATMFAPAANRYYLGLLASTGLAFSFWYITLSRSGFRASLLLLLYVLMAYLFWLGWQRKSVAYMAGAGLVLGLSQYTYWLAALLPLQFGLFALLWSMRGRPDYPLQKLSGQRRQLWGWIGLMAVTSLLVFIPLGRLYLTDPTILQYLTQSTAGSRVAGGELSWLNHLGIALRVFFDGPVGLWRGDIVRIWGFDWLMWLGFWGGIVVSVRRRRQPAYLFLLTGLFVFWLPAPLNDIDFSDLRLPAMLPVHHAISKLRVAGVLPVYFTLAAIGIWSAVEWVMTRFKWPKSLSVGIIGAFMVVFLVSGGVNSYNFFVRWPRQP